MKSYQDIIATLNRSGTNKTNRFLPFLLPEYVLIDERNSDDLINFTKKLASAIKFHDLDGSTDNWVNHFSDTDYPTGENPPHIALLHAFLGLLEITRNNINTLSKRHLDFFYQQVLRLSVQEEKPDSAHLIIQLAQNSEDHFLKQGTLFKAGKDSQGNDLHYSLNRDTEFNQALLTDIKTLFIKQFFREVTDIQSKPQTIRVTRNLQGKTVATDAKSELRDLPLWSALGAEEDPSIELGIAISSPILLMEEGYRTVTVKIRGSYTGSATILDEFKSAVSINDFRVCLSAETGWLEIGIKKPFKVTGGDGGDPLVLELKMEVDKKESAIVSYDEAIHNEGLKANYPVIKLLVNPSAGSHTYSVLDQMEVSRIDLKVDVKGVTNLILQNDESSLDPSKPFLPFGGHPVEGSNFYLGSEEIFYKKLNSLVLNLEWHNKPNSLEEHYRQYPTKAPYTRSDNDFTVELSILDDKTWKKLAQKGKQVHLFYTEPAPAAKDTGKNAKGGNDNTTQLLTFESHSIQVKQNHEQTIDKGDVIETSELELDREVTGSGLVNYNLKTLRGFMKLSLNEPDFGHKDFPSLYASAINQGYRNTQVTGNRTNEDLPPQPYTPTLRGLSVDYSSEVLIENDNQVEQFFHLHPFGWSMPGPNESAVLLPQYIEEGSLFLGLENVRPSQEITLLFQIAEATADPDVNLPEVRWDFLSGNQWSPIEPDHILYDSINGFNTPGLWTFKVPKRFSTNNTILPEGKFWLRASALENAKGVCKVINIKTQAALVTFFNQNNTTEHLASPLAPFSIDQLKIPDPNIIKVEQPFASFGGKISERDSEFYQRISERIRHKHRAVTLWDYEHLILEKFPEIYKAKAFNHSSAETGATVGNVLIIVVPMIRNHDILNPLKPMASLSTLESIEDYLVHNSPQQLNIEVKNPLYEEIQLSFLVKFKDGLNRGYYEQQLGEKIRKFLSPWAFDEGKDISFGGSIFKSNLLNFVEEQPFVEFVTFFRMDQYDTRGHIRSNVEEAIATTPVSILVSAEKHQITVLEDDRELCADGIGYMIVEETFTLIK